MAPEIHAAAAAAASKSSSEDDDDDVVLVGTANESRLPHMRQHCPDKKFVPDVVHYSRVSHLSAAKRLELSQAKTGNTEFCNLCFCYVCDKPAQDCTSWGGNHTLSYASHCHASDAGVDARIWKNKRERVKHGNVLRIRRFSVLGGSRGGGSHTLDPLTLGSGPFAPTNTQAAASRILTQCRCCGFHRNHCRPVLHGRSMQGGSPYPIGSQDWCHACGRIASNRDFGKLQSKPYTRVAGDVFLGKKVIPFTIVAHDPRQMEKYQEKWASSSWQYSEQDMEEDVFKHRFGKYPRIEMILESIPVVNADKVPKSDGSYGETFQVHYTSDYRRGQADPLYDDSRYDSDGNRNEHVFTNVSADETDAMILTNPSDCTFLEELKSFDIGGRSDGGNSANTRLRGDIVATWNRMARSGFLTVRVFIPQGGFSGNNRNSASSLTRFLGSYFNVFPLNLLDVCGPVCAKETSRPQSSEYNRIGNQRDQAAFDKVSEEMKSQVQEHNDSVQLGSDELSLNTSANISLMGGVCLSEAGLSGVLKQYYRESFAGDVNDSNGYSLEGRKDLWCDRGRGLISTHRKMRTGSDPIDPRRSYSSRLRSQNDIQAYLSNEDFVLAISNLSLDCQAIMDNTKSMKGLLEHLENLHHASVPFIEGLNVELLAFQRQSVQWALERETTPGGVQSFLWPKLPSVADPGEEVYYNPILERFRRDKPHLVRGGIIAEEMGMGKTIISLGIFLQNPAPAVPQSGSAVTVLNDPNNPVNAPGAPQTWDKDLYARTSSENGKRGSIISRGTLVVCHVSLVGQWIDEAKSKLKDPGLVYPYHGQSRKRNAAALAQNAIVVTTYQTLASDATYHAKKGGDDYCAPCEQVRWWRIICDESHSLSEASTKKSQAVMNLVADHKWLVSGTPVNTTFNDLKNQLTFIGLENVTEMFQVFLKTAFLHTKDQCVPKRSRSYYGESRTIGPFMFLLRSIMIRHTQKMTYRGTKTTLMSLPPKTERSVEVEFSEEEKEDYAALDKAARDFYTSFKERKGHELSKHYLLLTQKLVPLRIAASGGRIPLEDEEETAPENEEKAADPDVESDDDSEDEAPAPKKKKAKKEKRYSEFAYRSKLDALIAELESARDDDPNAKSLVFSQFTSTLNYLQQELPKHGFQYRTLSGDMSMKKRAKALHDFQHDPPTTIFLLSMRAGAVGINLTQANRVFLMEPSFNPALEAQAIGRVHRLGQTRNVEIVRFVMKGSVEKRIMKMLKKKYSGADKDEPVEVVGSKKNKRVITPFVGSIHTDRTAVLGDEFDMLFGVADAKEEPGAKEEESTSEGMDVEPDKVDSLDEFLV